jgi:hypothetical protein
MPENKERLPINPTTTETREIKIEDLEQYKDEPLPREIETWMEKVEKTANTTVTDQQGQTVMQPTAPTSSTSTVLPVTRQAFTLGLKKKFEDAGRWLSEYIFRVIKLKRGEVKFKQP